MRRYIMEKYQFCFVFIGSIIRKLFIDQLNINLTLVHSRIT